MLFIFRHLIALVALMLSASTGWTATYSVSSEAGGSADFQTLSAALSSGQIKAGDTISLAPGPHGRVEIVGAQFDTPVTITTDAKNPAHLDTLRVLNSRNLTFENMQVWPRQDESDNDWLVYAEFGTDRITFRNLDIRSTRTAGRYRNWSKSDWFRWRKAGVRLLGDNGALLNSRVTGVSFGVSVFGVNGRVIGNQINGFSADAMRGIGDNGLFAANQVRDCVKIDDNHDDGFQSWSLDAGGTPGNGVRRNVTLENNMILEWTGSSSHPLRCELQGIGLYDGLYQGFVIRNNVISVTAWHGISGSGLIDSVIANNTLVNRDGPSQEKPWIGIFTHKDGRPSRNVTVANNMTARINIDGPSKPSTNLINNAIIPYPARELVDPYNGDFRPKPGSRLVGAADLNHATVKDMFGAQRKLGNGPDIGAIEAP